jgi:SecD/SecF fusion protein
MSDRQRHGFVLLLVGGLIAASIFVLTTQRTVLGLDLKGGIELVYQGQRTPQSPVNSASLNRAVDIMRSRVDQLGVSEPEIQTTGNSLITVGLPDVHDVARAEQEVGQTAQLFFYDWEANVLTPSGKPAAEGLVTQDPASTTLSTGGTAGQPGVPGAGGVPLYDAAKLAAKQPTGPGGSRSGPAYYFFGAPGSPACAAAAKAAGTAVVQGQHCLLNGPDSTLTDLYSGLPPGVTKADGELITVPQGTVVLQAANPSSSTQIKPNSPNAEYFVLKDDVGLTGNDITNPQPSSDQTGQPDVQFGFTGKGQTRFQKVTAAIAHRGASVSVGGNPVNQHFAVALDGQLVTVPQIDYRQYPDGITGGGADVTGSFTARSARDLATELRLGALPLAVRVVP